eukprot:COSAG02_NODE_63435_length_263_cov_0.628049_1_plen_78_part_10
MPVHSKFFSACYDGRVGEIEGLLAEGVSPNATDSYGEPAVVAAAVMGRTAVLGVLLGAPGLAVDSPDPYGGGTALVVA